MCNRIAKLVLIACVGFMGLFICAPLHAGTVDLVSNSVVSETGGPFQDAQNQSNIPLTNTPVTLSTNVPTTTTGAKADGSVSGMAGTLTAFSHAKYPLGNNFTAQSDDKVTVVDSGPANSTSLTITMQLNGTYSPQEGTTVADHNNFIAEVAYSVRLHDSTNNNISDAFMTYDTGNKSYGLPQLTATISGVAATDTIEAIYTLEVFTYVDGELTSTLNNIAVADLASTARVFIDTNSGDFIGSTGYDYASTVPIPGTAYLLGSGLLGLIGLRRKIKG